MNVGGRELELVPFVIPSIFLDVECTGFFFLSASFGVFLVDDDSRCFVAL